MSAATDLVHRMLAAARRGDVSRRQRREMDAEAAALGPEAMSAAQESVGEQREAERAMVLLPEVSP